MRHVIQVPGELDEEQARRQLMLESAKIIAKEKGKIKRVIDRNGKTFWLVQSANEKTPEKVYDVTFDEMLSIFTCTCSHFENKLETCKHIISVALFEGGLGEQ